jgi:hypothetical protein
VFAAVLDLEILHRKSLAFVACKITLPEAIFSAIDLFEQGRYGCMYGVTVNMCLMASQSVSQSVRYM